MHTGMGTWTTGVTAIALCTSCSRAKKVQVGNDQEMVQSERNSHSKNRGEKKRVYN